MENLLDNLIQAKTGTSVHRRIPKGARFTVADKFFTTILRCIKENTIMAWPCLFLLAYQVLHVHTQFLIFHGYPLHSNIFCKIFHIRGCNLIWGNIISVKTYRISQQNWYTNTNIFNLKQPLMIHPVKNIIYYRFWWENNHNSLRTCINQREIWIKYTKWPKEKIQFNRNIQLIILKTFVNNSPCL